DSEIREWCARPSFVPDVAGAPCGLRAAAFADPISLLRLDAGRLDDPSPLRAVASQRRGGFLRCGRGRLEAKRVEALLHIGRRDRIADLAIEQSDNLSRRPGWR